MTYGDCREEQPGLFLLLKQLLRGAIVMIVVEEAGLADKI